MTRESWLDCASATETGIERDYNEDGAWRDEARGLCAVLDGMSGAARSGRYATELAMTAFASEDLSSSLSLDDRARALIASGHHAVYRAQGLPPYGIGFGCSAVVLCASRDEVAIASAGACTALRVRDGEPERIARPHDLEWDRDRRGGWIEGAAPIANPRSVLVNLLGINRSTQIDSALLTLRRDDVFVLCTDPLIECVSAAEIARIVGRDRSARTSADTIIALAVERVVTGNATVVVARFH